MSHHTLNKPVVALDLPIPAIEDMPEDTRKYFQICQEKLGMIPNVLTAYSQNLKQLEGFTRLYNELMLGEGELSKLEREMIAVVVSSENKCYYCLVAHGAAVRVLSGNPELGEQMVMNYRTADLDRRQRAMLDFAVQISNAAHTVGLEDRERLAEHGFSEDDIWDIGAIAAFFALSNRMANLTAMRPNDEFYLMGRVPRDEHKS